MLYQLNIVISGDSIGSGTRQNSSSKDNRGSGGKSKSGGRAAAVETTEAMETTKPVDTGAAAVETRATASVMVFLAIFFLYQKIYFWKF